MRVARSTEADLEPIQDLLQGAGLPLVGVPDAFRTGVVAHDGDALIGAAAMEPHGPVALLRSVVVKADHQGTGVGRALVSSIDARDRGGDATTALMRFGAQIRCQGHDRPTIAARLMLLTGGTSGGHQRTCQDAAHLPG